MWLERNREIVSEIKLIPSLRYGTVVGENESKTTSVKSLGSYQSQRYGELFMQVKKTTKFGDDDLLYDKIISEIALIDYIDRNLSTFTHEFPFFHGILYDGNGNLIGNIGEDFTKNEQCDDMYDLPQNKLPLEIFELLGIPIHDKRELATCGFILRYGGELEGKRRLGDFGVLTNRFAQMQEVTSEFERQNNLEDLIVRKVIE